MSKSPRTPTSSIKKFRLFSRPRKDSLKETPTPRLPTRDFTSSRGQANENIPPKLRIDTQMNHDTTVPPYMDFLEKDPNPTPLPSITSYKTITEEFPNPPPLPSDRPPRAPLSSSRSLHNLHENEIRNAQLSPTLSNRQKRSKPRPKGLVFKEPEACREYFLTNSPATALRDFPFHSFLSMVDSHPPEESVIVNPLPSVPSEESAELVDLDDYPWYFAEMVDTDTQVLCCLSPPAFLPYEDLCI